MNSLEKFQAVKDLGSDYHEPSWFAVIRTYFAFLSLSLSPLSSIIGSLRSDDGNGNENNLARASRFFVHFFAVVHDYNVKVPNFTFRGGRDYKTATFFFLFLNVDSVL